MIPYYSKNVLSSRTTGIWHLVFLKEGSIADGLAFLDEEARLATQEIYFLNKTCLKQDIMDMYKIIYKIKTF